MIATTYPVTSNERSVRRKRKAGVLSLTLSCGVGGGGFLTTTRVARSGSP